MHRRVMLAALAAGLVARRAFAQGAPVKLVIPFPPGGPVDTFGRILAPALGARLGQTVVLDNRAGAGGVIGMEAVARAAPDGLTIGFGGPGALAVAPTLLPRLPYDVARDFTPIAQAVGVPELLVVNPSLAARDVAGLVAMAKAQPGALNFASAGSGTYPHLAGELFRMRAGIEITHVPYRGAAPALTDLIAGRVQLMFADAPVVLPQIRAGALRALGVAARRRFAPLPEVPTMAEAGLPGVEAESWYGIVAPANLPPERLATLHRALLEALADPEVKRLLADQGAEGIGDTPADFAAHLRSEIAKWGEVVRTAGVKPE